MQRICFFVLVLLVFHSFCAQTRRYYISADEEEWNYAPSGFDLVTEQPVETSPESSEFFERGPNRIGGTYIKALYREYTDSSFTEKIPRVNHLGFLGPILWTEVGDTIKVSRAT